MIAWINGLLGIALAFFIGLNKIELNAYDVVLSIGASWVSGMIALLLVLKGERTPWIKRHVLTRSLRTWPIFLLLYYGGIWLLAPPLRSMDRLIWMAVPLALCNGFVILAFGPLQDRIIAQVQRRSRTSTT